MALPDGRRLGALPPPGTSGEHDLILGQTLDSHQGIVGPTDGQTNRRRRPMAQDATMRRIGQIVVGVDGSVGMGIGQTDGGGFVRLAIFRQAEALALLALLPSASLGLGSRREDGFGRAYLGWTLGLRGRLGR